jgi:Protein of unknown function (DUF4089)
MAKRDDPAIAAYIETTSQLLRLPIAAEHRAGVEGNFARIAELAELFIDAPLELHDEPAPVFRPGSPL